ncbi:hypothetical protein Rhe02_16570 [Rhizocola hellebori]|uniref:Uncharacterized protein n=2 Tax=Rhizocola hellebori TaxID=1392758 RepID=A0A8J3Q5I7_9ACTN|nr:hypothetical protein Rhe02_16570 [Rhizocola hellebori]
MSLPSVATSPPLHCGPDMGSAQRRQDLIASHIPMATRVARSFGGRGEDLDDLIQVALLELVKAASKFDPARGVAFAQYAYPCIAGGVKKHFRDNGWSLRVARRTQELHLQTSHAIPALTQLLGRHPTVTDLAAHLHLSEVDAREGVQGGLAYSTRSLNSPVGDSENTEPGLLIGGLDERIESVPDRLLLGVHMAVLPRREQDVLRLRFSADLSQNEIAKRLGISQMQVSRLLARSIDQLRIAMLPH